MHILNLPSFYLSGCDVLATLFMFQLSSCPYQRPRLFHDLYDPCFLLRQDPAALGLELLQHFLVEQLDFDFAHHEPESRENP